MTAVHKAILGLDIGHKRIGVAIARGGVRLAVPLDTIEVDGHELQRITDIFTQEDVATCVVGLPRNQSGEETKQSEWVRRIAQEIEHKNVRLIMQDESLTSVRAKTELGDRAYDKGQIDALAATYILQDYLETL